MKSVPRVVWLAAIAVILILATLFFAANGSEALSHRKANAVFAKGESCEEEAALAGLSTAEREQLLTCAADSYREAIELYEGDWRYHFRLAEVLGEDNPEAALEGYVRAEDLAPDQPGPNEGLERLMASAQAERITFDDAYVFYADELPEDRVMIEGEFDLLEINESDLYTYGDSDRALQIRWDHSGQGWGTIILGIDEQISDRAKALAGEMDYISLEPPGDFVLQFYARGTEGTEVITIKLQDQNTAIVESLGSQLAILVSMTTAWQEYCISLDKMIIDDWIRTSYPEAEFMWSEIKQINIDPLAPRSGTIYLDELRIVRDPAACD